MKRFDQMLFRVLLITAILFMGYLLWLTATTRFTLVNSSDEAVVQLAQWTIATILTAGAALIGLNWYQGEKRYERDKDELNREMVQLQEGFEKRFRELELANQETLDEFSRFAVGISFAFTDDLDLMPRLMSAYKSAKAKSHEKKAIAEHMANSLKDALGEDPTLPSQVWFEYEDDLVSTIKDEYPQFAEEIRTTAQKHREHVAQSNKLSSKQQHSTDHSEGTLDQGQHPH